MSLAKNVNTEKHLILAILHAVIFGNIGNMIKNYVMEKV